MKLTAEFIKLCDYAVVAQDGKLNLLGLFEEVRVLSFPGGLARAFIVATLQGESNATYKITLRAESKTAKSPLNPLSMNVVTGPNGKNNVIAELTNVIFQEPGEYQFVIMHEDAQVGSTVLKVVPLKQNEKGARQPN